LVYSLVPSAVRTQIESRVGFKGSDEEAGQAASDDTSVVATSATQSTTTASQEPAALLKAKRTSDEHFPRVESAKDSLGHAAERPMHGGSFYAHTGHVLRPGQQVTFELEASAPNGDDLELSVIAPARGEADVAIADGIVTWNVRDQDIADPAHLNIYVASQRSYHRQQDWDDAAVFVYRVLPRL